MPSRRSSLAPTIEPQSFQAREHEGNATSATIAREASAGAMMRDAPNAMLFDGIARYVEAIGIGEAGLVAISRAEHEEHAIFRLEIDAAERPRFATRRGDMPIGAIQRAYSSNASIHFAFRSRTSAVRDGSARPQAIRRCSSSTG